MVSRTSSPVLHRCSSYTAVQNLTQVPKVQSAGVARVEAIMFDKLGCMRAAYLLLLG